MVTATDTAPSRSRPRRPPGLEALANVVRTRGEGSRNTVLYWATMRAVEEDYAAADIATQLYAAALESGLEHRESLATIRSGIERAEAEGKRSSLAPHRPNEGRPRLMTYEEWLADPRNDEDRAMIEAARQRAGRTDDIEDDFQRHWEYSTGQPGAGPGAAPATIFTNVSDYCAGVPDEVPWLVEPLAYFGGVTLLAGIWKGGKSTLIAQCLRARETGEEFLGRRIPIGPTVLITEEGGIALKRKVGGLAELVVLDRRNAVQNGLTFDDVLEAVNTFCASQTVPVLVVVDTFAVWGEVDDENDASEITRTLNKLTVTAQSTGAAIILVDHVRKEGGTHGRGIRGSGAKAATVDIFAELNYVENGQNTDRSFKLEGRVIEPTDMRLSFDRDTRSYTVIDRQEAELDEIEDWLTDIPETGDGLTMKDLQDLWGTPRQTAAKKAKWLTNKGRLRERKARIPGNNAMQNVYWAIPAAGYRPTTTAHGQEEPDVDEA